MAGELVMKFDGECAKGEVKLAESSYGAGVFVDGEEIAFIDLFYRSKEAKEIETETDFGIIIWGVNGDPLCRVDFLKDNGIKVTNEVDDQVWRFSNDQPG